MPFAKWRATYYGEAIVRIHDSSPKRCRTYLSAKAITHGAQLLDALIGLEPFDSFDNDGVNVFLGVRVVAVRALFEPREDFETLRWIQADRVAIEEVDDEGQIAVLGKLVGNQLAVLPDANYIRKQ